MQTPNDLGKTTQLLILVIIELRVAITGTWNLTESNVIKLGFGAKQIRRHSVSMQNKMWIKSRLRT